MTGKTPVEVNKAVKKIEKITEAIVFCLCARRDFVRFSRPWVYI
jgi:hypothetical protein